MSRLRLGRALVKARFGTAHFTFTSARMFFLCSLPTTDGRAHLVLSVDNVRRAPGRQLRTLVVTPSPLQPPSGCFGHPMNPAQSIESFVKRTLLA